MFKIALVIDWTAFWNSEIKNKKICNSVSIMPFNGLLATKTSFNEADYLYTFYLRPYFI